MDPHEPSPRPARRDFLKKAAAVIVGALAGMVPVLTGWTVFLDPLRRKSEAGAAVRVTSLSALPEDGLPRRFAVVASHRDAWNRMPQVPVGAVYLRRAGGGRVQAFNVICPHAGCFVDFNPSAKAYHCPCHNSSFALDGSIADPKSPSPRGLDELEVEIRNENEVWVKFRNFRAGHKEKVAV